MFWDQKAGMPRSQVSIRVSARDKWEWNELEGLEVRMYLYSGLTMLSLLSSSVMMTGVWVGAAALVLDVVTGMQNSSLIAHEAGVIGFGLAAMSGIEVIRHVHSDIVRNIQAQKRLLLRKYTFVSPQSIGTSHILVADE